MTNDKNNTKYIILVGDGMADYPLNELNGKTPLEAAETPFMDRIASVRVGLTKTIPDGMEPGSDIANLSLLGYEPKIYHTGRSPLEAASMGVTLQSDQVAFRMNLVTLDHKSPDEIIMVSHSSGDISTDEASKMIGTLKQTIKIPGLEIFQGIAYRHLLLWKNGPEDAVTIPPHDVLDQNMAGYLKPSPDDPVPELIRLSWEILHTHPVNQRRRKEGLKQANSIWLWGQGKAPKLPSFKDRFGLSGGVISAVDLLKGIGIYAGFIPLNVKGATGYLDTNYLGKAEKALEKLEALDFIFLHVEAPDEAAHNGSPLDKIQAIEDFDHKVVGKVLDGLRHFENYRVMVVSDHFTPIPIKTHTAEPTPFAWATRAELGSPMAKSAFTEKNALDSGLYYEKGHELIQDFLFKV